MIVTKLIITDLMLAQTLSVNRFLLNCVHRRLENGCKTSEHHYQIS